MTQPIVWCVGGIDSSGGAGVTRDAITLADLNVHACILTTQLTVQSNDCMLSRTLTSASAINELWQVLIQCAPPLAIKIGALANDEQALALCAKLQSLSAARPFVVWDPVLQSSSGGTLSELSRSVIVKLLNAVDVVTPNIDELVSLSGIKVNSTDAALKAANALLRVGAQAILVKGGHAHWQDVCCDTLITGSHLRTFVQPKDEHGQLRGTGCMLASAICAFTVQQYGLDDAVTLANAYVKHVRDKSVNPAQTLHIAKHTGFPDNPHHFPVVTHKADDGNCEWLTSHERNEAKGFPALSTSKLGIYPVVDSVDWITRLLSTGVRIMQLRVKEGSEASIRTQIAQAINATKHTQCMLFINDYWALAIELGAYGVHLGQEDIDTADLHAIQKAGLRLGISTHGYAEIQRAKALKPSYIALGHIFPTNTKLMPSRPQGIDRLAKYVTLCENIPTVAIGGINNSRIRAVAATKVNSVAVVSAVTQASDPINAYYALEQEAGFAQ